MSDSQQLYQKSVFFLAQTFFIKDNRDELLLCAHKYDFDIRFFDQMLAFTKAVESASQNCLLVIDLDVLYSMQTDMAAQKRQTMFLSDLLQRLPEGHEYIYLQSVRQGERFLLQQKLVSHQCLAYAEKPIRNDVLVDKLFHIFARRSQGENNTVMYLGEQLPLSASMLAAHGIQLVHCTDPQSLHRSARERQPDIMIIDERQYQQSEGLVGVMKKNIEADPGREIIMLQRSFNPNLSNQALDSGFDEIVFSNDDEVLSRRIINRIMKLRAARDLINRDRATGLLNKVGLQRKAQDKLRQASKEGKSLVYCVIDIDKFKTINDTWGHYFGDIVIKRLSLLLSAQMGELDLLSRFGGEEFVMLLWDCDSEQGLAKLNRIRELFHAIPFEVAAGDIRHFSFSGGMTSFPLFQSENDLFLHADEMLYQAKQGGRNQICAYPG